MVKINLKTTVIPVAGDKLLISSDISDANSAKQTLCENIAKTTKLDDLATPDDNTDLNSTITEHGLCPKLSGNPAQALLGDGSWGSLGGSGDVVGPAISNNNYFPIFNGATGKLLKQIGVPFYWDGSLSVLLKVDEGKIGTESTAGTEVARIEITDGWPKLWASSGSASGNFWCGIYDDFDLTVWTIGVTGANELAFGNNGSKRIRILSTGQIQFNMSYTFPTSDGTTGQTLTTNGSGALSFSSVGSGSTKTMTTDTTGVTAKDLVEMRKSNVISRYLHVYKPGRVSSEIVSYGDDDIQACDVVALNEHKMLTVQSDTTGDVYGTVFYRDPAAPNLQASSSYATITTVFTQVQRIKMVAMREDLALCFIESNTNTNSRLCLIRVNGYQIEVVCTILWNDGGSPLSIDLLRIDDRTAVCMASFTGLLQLQMIKISDDDRLIRGSKTTNTDPVADASSLALSRIDANSFMIAYNDSGSSGYGYLTHCRITENQQFIFGTRSTFYSTANCNYLSLQMLSGNNGVVSYADTTSGTNCRVKAFTYENNDTFTFGTAIQPFSSGTACTFTRLERISKSHFIIVAKTNYIHYNTGHIIAGETIRYDQDLEAGGADFDATGYTDLTVGLCRLSKYKYALNIADTGTAGSDLFVFDIQNPVSKVVGIATETKGASQACIVGISGSITLSALIAGSSYWASATGSLSNAASETGIKVGTAVSTTELIYNMEYYENSDNEPVLDTSKNSVSFEGKITGWTKFTPPVSRTSDSVFEMASADMNQMENLFPIEMGTPIRFRETNVYDWSYSIITAKSVDNSQLTIAGDPYTAGIHASATRQFEIGPSEKVVSKRYFISGTFANAIDADLLANDMDQYDQWSYGQARLVRIVHKVKTADTGASQPRVNALIDGQSMDQSNGMAGLPVSTLWVYSGTNLDSFNIGYMNDITIQTDANGTNNDASDLTMIMTFVLV